MEDHDRALDLVEAIYALRAWAGTESDYQEYLAVTSIHLIHANRDAVKTFADVLIARRDLSGAEALEVLEVLDIGPREAA